MLAILVALQSVAAPAAPTAADSVFGRQVVELSEPGGVFFSDNLVSNETSYLHVIGKLDELALRGGAYIGVGPEQNFSYIAEVRPAVAYLIDIRRDNLLLHLFFKAAFELAENRFEYLCLVFGRPIPDDVELSTGAPLESLLDQLDRISADSAARAAQEVRVFARIRTMGVPLSAGDLATIERLHGEFVREGPDLRFSSVGRRSWTIYPTARSLYLSRDLRDRPTSYLATEDRFRVVQQLQRAGRVIPVVGDVAGPHAIRAIGRHAASLGERVSLFYLSNVEFYLFRAATFPAFTANVAALPLAERSYLVRSYFDRQSGLSHPLAVPGHFSVQLLQSIGDFLARTTADPAGLDYWDLVNEGAIPLAPAAGGDAPPPTAIGTLNERSPVSHGRPGFEGVADDGLLSHHLTVAVPSALRVLTTVFGMGTGVAPAR